ncbi:phosphoribosylanthranilate isomerase [Altererythrobacter lauratis]|uniref:N-(5'-phosphoribosyl)anthranilate isomerase n=1 Tax=Alteraurantiacibacter lauratis TaxID=2054627 RepID=A0ABV7EHX7_9SPHN
MANPLIKICGLSTPESIASAAAAGASHVGLVHYAPSPRHVEIAQAAQLRRAVPPGVKAVLLVVNMAPDALAQAVAAIRPDVVQFHGQESPQECAAFRAASGLEVWKAKGIKTPADLAEAQAYAGALDRLLYDAPAGKLPGGQGIALDWSLLAGYRHRIPWGLAGGLNADNVAEAIRQTKAPLVDTSSGVESAPGIKDVDRIKAFCQAARAIQS